MKWALIGASDIAATRMIPAMRELGHEVVGVMSSNAARAQEYATKNGLKLHTDNLETAVSWDVDAVYISTTNDLHKEQAIAAAKAGKHILCEKAIAIKLSDALEMVNAAKEAKVVFATNHHLRCSATHRKIRELVTSGKLGTIFSARVNHAVSLPERLRGWRLDSAEKGAGVVLDIAVHDVDTIRAALAADISEVTALTSTQGLGTNGVEDSAMCIFRMDNGVLVSSHESFMVPYGTTSVEINGSLGSIRATGVMTQDPVGEVVLKTSAGEEIVDVGDRGNLYIWGLQKFVGAVNGTEEPAATAEDGIASLAGALAVLESAKSKRTVNIEEILKGASL